MGFDFVTLSKGEHSIRDGLHYETQLDLYAPLPIEVSTRFTDPESQTRYRLGGNMSSVISARQIPCSFWK